LVSEVKAEVCSFQRFRETQGFQLRIAIHSCKISGAVYDESAISSIRSFKKMYSVTCRKRNYINDMRIHILGVP
jgi:hypothetical protein